LGITTIVDLRGEDREKIAWERQRAESLGLRFVHIPSMAGLPQPTNRSCNFSLFSATILGKKSSCTATSATIAPAFSPPYIAWPFRNGPLNKPSRRCISLASTASGIPP